jgi:dihydrolipoamide dehydrogenase
VEERQGRPRAGGTCTNVGCIPSKALLQSSEHFEHAGHGFADHGIKVSGLALDIDKMLARKDTVVKQNNDGIPTCSRRTRSRSSTAVARS